LSRDGSASPDTRAQGQPLLSTTEAPGKDKHSGTPVERARRGGRRARGQGDNVRYFVGRLGDGDNKPMLEQEVASEPEALVIAFKNDSRVYFISEYRVTQRIEGSQVRLEKEQVAPVQRVSNLNGS
jgi:hypothetical protein